MAQWSALVAPLLDWPVSSHTRAVENARRSCAEACRRRVEREEVAAYLLARTAVVRREGTRIAHSG